MKLGGPIQVAEGIYQLRAIGARVTVLTSGDEVALVDAGARGSVAPISSGLKAMGLSLEQVALIVLTHYHPDHCGGLGGLARATAARVAVHRKEADVVSGKEVVPSPFRNSLIAGVTRPFVSRLYGEPVKVDYPLDDQERLPFDDDVRIIHTPGHTPGSISLYVASKKVLIVGDALQYKFGRLRPPAQPVTLDPVQAAESLEKLLSVDFDTICFSHFAPLKRNAKDALRQLVERSS